MLHLALALAAFCSSPDQEAFRTVTFDQAQTAAQQEKKVVLIDFFTTWCVPCKKLDETTWKDEAVLKWIGEHCVALKLDAEKNVELAQRFHVGAYPTVLLLKADGSVIDRLVGYKDAKEFLSAAADALAGKDSLARAKAKLVGHEKDPMERQQYADELARAGKHEEALAEYLWCFDNGKSSEGYGGVRRSFLLSDIQQLGRLYPAALKALEERRDATEARIRAGSTDYDDVADTVALNSHLGTNERSLALFDDLKRAGPIPERLRYRLFLQLKGALGQAKRFDDLLGLIADPVDEVARSIENCTSMRKMSERAEGKQKEVLDEANSVLRNHTIDDDVLIFEALVSTKRGPEADKVCETLIAFDATGKTFAALIKAADRAGAAERVKALGERGMASLPEKEQAEVKKALARAAKPK